LTLLHRAAEVAGVVWLVSACEEAIVVVFAVGVGLVAAG